MATVTTSRTRGNGYPTSDGRPMAETDVHRDLMMDSIQRLQRWFANDLRTYVSGNLLVFYVQGDKRKHVAPDVFAVRGVSKAARENYLIWEERKGPEAVIELTSRTTRKEDTDKFKLYRDVLQVREYFLCDPRAEYLKPPLQGFRLEGGEYHAIAPVDHRLPSEVLGLHLERNGNRLEFFDPGSGQWVPTNAEIAEEAQKTVLALEQRCVEVERGVADLKATLHQEKAARLHAEAELARLQREIAALRGSSDPTISK
jgi:Uma2 family endonuclease